MNLTFVILVMLVQLPLVGAEEATTKQALKATGVIKPDAPAKEVFEVTLRRGSIAKFKKSEYQHWKRFYPCWRKGRMLDKVKNDFEP